MGINGGTGIVGSGATLGGSGIHINRGGGEVPFSFGNALQFDGVNDYVTVPSIPISGEFTLNIWFNSNFTSKSSPMLFSNNAAAKYIRTVRTFGGGSAMYVLLGGSLNQFTFPVWNDNTWYMFTLTRDASNNLKAYINAVESTLTGVVDANNTTFQLIGAYYTLTAFGFIDGKLDEIGFLSGTAATPTQISNLYNLENGNDFNTVVGSSDVYYQFNQTSPDSTATDSSGNGNTGALNNFDFATCWVAH